MCIFLFLVNQRLDIYLWSLVLVGSAPIVLMVPVCIACSRGHVQYGVGKTNTETSYEKEAKAYAI